MSPPQMTAFSLEYSAGWVHRLARKISRTWGQADAMVTDSMGVSFKLDVLPGVVFFPLQVQLIRMISKQQGSGIRIDWSCVGMPAPFLPKARHDVQSEEHCCDWTMEGLPLADDSDAAGENCLRVGRNYSGLPPYVDPKRRSALSIAQEVGYHVDWSADGLPTSVWRTEWKKREALLLVDWSLDGLPQLQAEAVFHKSVANRRQHQGSGVWKTLCVDWSCDALPLPFRSRRAYLKPYDCFYIADWSQDGLPNPFVLRETDMEEDALVVDWSRNGLPAQLLPKTCVKGPLGARRRRYGQRVPLQPAATERAVSCILPVVESLRRAPVRKDLYFKVAGPKFAKRSFDSLRIQQPGGRQVCSKNMARK